MSRVGGELLTGSFSPSNILRSFRKRTKGEQEEEEMLVLPWVIMKYGGQVGKRVASQEVPDAGGSQATGLRQIKVGMVADGEKSTAPYA